MIHVAYKSNVMKYKVRVLSFNKVDKDNDKFTRSSVKTPLHVPVTIDFKSDSKIATAKITKQLSGLFAEFETSISIKGKYPAIGFQLISSSYDEETKIRTIKEIKLEYIGVCLNPNSDITIKPI